MLFYFVFYSSESVRKQACLASRGCFFLLLGMQQLGKSQHKKQRVYSTDFTLFTQKVNMNISVQLYFVPSASGCICAPPVSAGIELIYQAAIYQAASQPDNLQVFLLPGWATFHSSNTALCYSHISHSWLQSKSWNQFKDFVLYSSVKDRFTD